MTPRAKRGFTRLAWVIGVPTAAYAFVLVSLGGSVAGAFRLLEFWSQRWGGPWILVVLYAAGAWVWVGFRVDPGWRKHAKVLRTRRLLMRRALFADLGALHAILHDPEAMRYWDTLAHATPEETQKLLDRLIAAGRSLSSDGFIVEHRGRVIGMLGSLQLPWLTFVLDRREWRKGFAAEALAAFADYMFERGVPYLAAATDERNEAARALLEKAGFRETERSTGQWRVQGEPADAVHFRLDRPFEA